MPGEQSRPPLPCSGSKGQGGSLPKPRCRLVTALASLEAEGTEGKIVRGPLSAHGIVNGSVERKEAGWG